jgi:hypothetical protein
MADFTLYHDMVLLRDIPKEGLYAGDVSTIVEEPGERARGSI